MTNRREFESVNKKLNQVKPRNKSKQDQQNKCRIKAYWQHL